MHIDKYKIQNCCAMILHYTRGRKGTLERENIDKSRTYLNYEIGEKFSYDDILKIKENVKNSTGRSVRSDAIVMSDIVITLPPNAKDASEFFQSAYDSIRIQLYAHGLSENAPICGYIHNDETTPHMHLSFVPLKKDKNDNDIFSFKTICKRGFYQNFHKDTEDYIEKDLGYRPALLIAEDENLNSVLSRADIDQKSYKKLSNRLENEINKEIKEKEQVLAEKKVRLLELTSKSKNFKKIQKYPSCDLVLQEKNKKRFLQNKNQLEELNSQLNTLKQQLIQKREYNSICETILNQDLSELDNMSEEELKDFLEMLPLN